MKKVLFVCDENFSDSTFSFGAYLNNNERILLTGIFIPSIDYSKFPNYTYAKASASMLMFPEYYATDESTLDTAPQKFAQLCQQQGIEYRIHKDASFTTLQELLEETRFADLAIISSELFFMPINDYQPNSELREVLQNAECPVILIPKTFSSLQNIVLAYDGSKACMAAIREFGQWMTAFSNLPVTLVHYSIDANEPFPYETSAREYLTKHFSNLTLTVLEKNQPPDFNEWMSTFTNPLLVTGAYSRTGLSMFFKKSFIDHSIRQHAYPIFIFHNYR